MTVTAFLRHGIAQFTRGTHVQIELRHGIEKVRGEWWNFSTIKLTDTDTGRTLVFSTPPVQDEEKDQEHVEYVYRHHFEDLEVEGSPIQYEQTEAQRKLAKN